MSFRASPFAALILLLALSTCVQAHPKNLFVPARKSAPIDGIDDNSQFYSWLSDHSLLGNRQISASQWQYVRIDLSMKTVSPIAGLNKVLGPMNSADSLAEPELLASPNGKWVLVYGLYHFRSGTNAPDDNAPIRRQVTAYSIDGSRKIVFAESPDPTDPNWLAQSVLAWLPNSESWVEITNHEVFFFSLDNPTSPTGVPVVSDSAMPADTGPGQLALLTVTQSGHAILGVGSDWYLDNDYQICDLDLNTNPIQYQPITIPTPPQSNIDAVAVSPDGRKVAWEWNIDGDPSDRFARGTNAGTVKRPAGDHPLSIPDNAAWWRAHDPPVRYTTDPDNRVELWTSNIDGSAFHLIGRADSGSATLLWSPDGKSLYFTFGNRFWGFPVR